MDHSDLLTTLVVAFVLFLFTLPTILSLGLDSYTALFIVGPIAMVVLAVLDRRSARA